MNLLGKHSYKILYDIIITLKDSIGQVLTQKQTYPYYYYLINYDGPGYTVNQLRLKFVESVDRRSWVSGTFRSTEIYLPGLEQQSVETSQKPFSCYSQSVETDPLRLLVVTNTNDEYGVQEIKMFSCELKLNSCLVYWFMDSPFSSSILFGTT